MQTSPANAAPRRGTSDWPAQVKPRALGAALLCASAACALILHRQVGQPFAHPATPGELALGACAVACLWAGLAALAAGPRLFAAPGYPQPGERA